MTRSITVTLCSSAYSNLESDTRTEFDPDLIADVLPVDEELGIGKTIIFFHDGSTANVLETEDEMCIYLQYFRIF
ncbi:MAG: hypothetical protein RL204_661 [Bacteroidota bacterium]|jgi:hypothetical protein